jgi:hypothetical protein
MNSAPPVRAPCGLVDRWLARARWYSASLRGIEVRLTAESQRTGVQQTSLILSLRLGLMGPEKLEKVLEKLAVTDKATLVCEKAPEGKIRVTSNAWASEKVILKGEVLEVRNVDGRLQIARKERRHDEWDPPIEPYDPYGPGEAAVVLTDG